MSGLRWPSPERAPLEVKEANRRKPGLAIKLFVKVAEPPFAARSNGPVAEPVPRNGMVTVYGSPVSGFCVIGPS